MDKMNQNYGDMEHMQIVVPQTITVLENLDCTAQCSINQNDATNIPATSPLPELSFDFRQQQNIASCSERVPQLTSNSCIGKEQNSEHNIETEKDKEQAEQRSFSEFQDFRCKHIGKQLKRPIIRPHSKFQKSVSADVYQISYDAKVQKRRKTLLEVGYGPKNSVGKLQQVLKSNRDKHMLRILENQMYPDVLVKVGNVTFNCHNILLQMYSTYFKERYNEPIITLNDKSITPEAFATVYEWMLESIPLIPREPLMALFNAATSLRVDELIKGCWHCMDADMVHLCEDQAILLYLEGQKFNLKNVQSTILQRVSKVFLTFVACREFVEMSCDEVCALLTSNNIGVNSELEVLLSAARWVNYDLDNRRQFAERLLGCVRFSLLPAWYLLQLQNKTLDSPEFSWIVLSSHIMETVRKAFMYCVTQAQFGNDNTSFQQWCLNEGIRRPTDRKWIYDKACSYHHRFTCSRLHVVTYEMFEEYLASIRKVGLDYWHCIEWSYGGRNDACCCSDDVNFMNENIDIVQERLAKLF